MRRILVLDCDKNTSVMCRDALEKLGHHVICQDSSDVAPEFVLKDKIDLVIVNLCHDEVGGVELFRQFRQLSPTLVGIVISDDAGRHSIMKAMNSGFSKICNKPVDIGSISKAVKSSLKITDLREEVTRMKTLLPLYNLGKCFIEARTEQTVYEQLVEAVCKETGVPKVSVMMFDETSESLKVVAFRGLDPKYVKDLEVKPGERISGRVFVSKLPVILNKDKQIGPYVNLLNRKELAAAISFPIASKGKVLGVLNVSETKDGTFFSDADIEMLSIISDQAMMAVENIRSIKEREEQNRMRTLIEQYVSPEVSNLLAQRNWDTMEKGTIQDLTVLFADIRNFTLLVQHLHPEQTRNFLNDFFEKFTTTIFSYNGMLDKFMGDAALAVFGAPIEIENASAAAVQAAQFIMSEFDNLQKHWCMKNSAFKKIGLGIGISRGPIFQGNVGFTKRLDYTVIGTDVNIAQRLASKSESGQLLITESVRQNLVADFPIKTEMQMVLRGIENEMTVYSI